MKFWKNIFQSIPDSDQLNGMTSEMKTIYISQLFFQKEESLLVVTNSLFEANLL